MLNDEDAGGRTTRTRLDNGKIMSSFLPLGGYETPENRLPWAMPQNGTPHNREVRIGVGRSPLATECLLPRIQRTPCSKGV